MTSSEQQERMANSAVSVLIVFCFLIPILAALLFQRPIHVPLCSQTKLGNVVSDSMIDGRLVFVTGAFAVRGVDNKQRFIAYCHKGGCDGPYQILKQERTGRQVHAEFCGRFLTLVSLDGMPIYIAQPLTQRVLNETSSNGRLVGVVLLITFLVLLLCSAFFLKR